MDEGGAHIGCGQGIGDHRARIELDHDSIGRVTGLLPRFRDDETDQIAAEAHLVVVEKGTLRKPASLRTAHREGRRLLQLGGRDHRDHSCG